ncbi:MAG: heterodisulfide reductase-related iron-sulfur binding cluster [Nitrospirota bacterium]|nr:heterodisulfide reductase-related iron-sulfur binding cluster [Nitrospirota bacterium]
MPKFDLITPGWKRSDLETETLRVFDICDGCRRCFNLCPSFTTLLNRIDDHESDVSKLTSQDFTQVEQECYYCKLCFNHCPYSPPHQYDLDFPRLMAAWKKQRTAEDGATWRDTLLIQTDLIGKLGSLTAPLTNWALRTPWVRGLVETIAGVHQSRQVLPFQSETFSQWWERRKPASKASTPQGRVAFFPSCLVTFQVTDIGKATIQILEKNGIEVVVPPNQHCCGMPRFDLGDTQGMQRIAEEQCQQFLPYLEKGYDIIIPAPSCSLMFKREYPYLKPSPEMTRLAEQTFDVCEYLMRLKKENRLSLDFPQNPGRVAYQIPCHLRDQNIGFKSKELMELTGAHVHLIEKCSGHDGAWSAKKEFFDMSMKIAKKAVREIQRETFDVVASDCPLSALQLDQALDAPPSRSALHPIQVVRNAYGLPS